MTDYENYIEESKQNIAAVLDSFKIGHGEIIYTPGPAVTLFEFRPAIGIRLSKIKNLKDEFTIALSSTSVRVIAPIPGRGTVGIEVPNKERQIVPYTEMLHSFEYEHTDMALPLVIGRTVNNGVFMVDLAEMPHLLVAGATGQGKSVGLNVMLASLLHKKSPDELKLVLIDPKQVELSIYNKIGKPYLAKTKTAFDPVATTLTDASNTLDNVCVLMDNRYDLLNKKGVRNIKEYNALDDVEKMPYYVVVVDEYGDLVMQSGGRDIEKYICRIAQKARAVGIHMIISTQRPSATIVTGNIKANFPTRISFRTTTGTDSRVVLDRVGAERLTGKGDMLFFSGAETTRVQCAYISTEEVIDLCDEIADRYTGYEQTILPEFDWIEYYKPKYQFDHVYPETEETAYKLRKKYPYGGYIMKGVLWGNVAKQLLEMKLIGECTAIEKHIDSNREYFCTWNLRNNLRWTLDNFYKKD